MYRCNRCINQASIHRCMCMYICMHVSLYVCMCVCRCVCVTWSLINCYIDIAASTLYPTTVSMTTIMLLCNSIWLTVMPSAGVQSSASSTHVKIKEKDQCTTNAWITLISGLISIAKTMRSVRHVARSPNRISLPLTMHTLQAMHNMCTLVSQSAWCMCLCC